MVGNIQRYIISKDVCWNIRNVKLKSFCFPEMRLYFLMFITVVCFLFLLKLRWPKNKSIHDLTSLLLGTPNSPQSSHIHGYSYPMKTRSRSAPDENLKFENSGIYDVNIHNSLLKVVVRFYNGFLQSRKNFSPETFSFQCVCVARFENRETRHEARQATPRHERVITYF